MSAPRPKSTDPDVLLTAADLSFFYSRESVVLDAISFRLFAATSMLLLGDNGSGKSTLGRLLAGLMRPTAGVITIRGQRPAELSPPLRVSTVSYMGQVSHLQVLTDSIARESDSFSRHATTQSFQYDNWCDDLALPSDQASNPRDLSTLELWRLLLLLYGLALCPSLLVVDEIVAPNDPLQRQCLLAVLAERRRLGTSTILMYQRGVDGPFDQILTLTGGALLANPNE
jgi:ABC-type multidrug transport system ATPase subunit